MFTNIFNMQSAEAAETQKNALVNLTVDEIVSQNEAHNKAIRDSQEYTEFVDNYIENNEDFQTLLSLQQSYNEIVNNFNELVRGNDALKNCWGLSIDSIDDNIKSIARNKRSEAFEFKTTSPWDIRHTINNMVDAFGIKGKGTKEIQTLVESFNELSVN